MLTTTAPAQPRYVPLSAEDLVQALRQLPAWHSDGTRLLRTVSPVELWPLLERVGQAEDELDHHSTICLDCGTVTFSLWTHVRDAVTEADVALARRIDVVAADLL